MPDQDLPDEIPAHESAVTVFETTSDDGDVATASLSRTSGATLTESGKAKIAQLNRLVLEKDHALMRAELAAQDLEDKLAREQEESLKLRAALVASKTEAESGSNAEDRELSAETKAELAKQKKEFTRIQKSLEREHSRRQAELAQARTQLFHTQQQLEQEKHARRVEAVKASLARSRLEQDLAAATGAIARSHAENTEAAAGKKWLTTAAVLLGISLGGTLIWTQLSAREAKSNSGVTATLHPAEPVPTASRAATSRPAPAHTEYTLAESSLSTTGFPGSLRQLNRALSLFGNRPPEEILREVRARSGDTSLCAFQWNNGQPALLYAGDGVKNTLASALTRCAAAVEQIPH